MSNIPDINATSDFFSYQHGSYMEGATALIIAVNDHCNDVAASLLRSIKDVNITNANGESAVHRFFFIRF
jgi:hypothetical protein